MGALLENNFLYKKRLDEIWYPSVHFEDIQEDIEDLDYTAYISKESHPLLIGNMDEIHIKEQYPGRENAVNMLTKKRSRFSCAFDQIRNYPFGSQECSLKIFFLGAANNLTGLAPEVLVNNGPTSFSQYLVMGWRVESIRDKFDINKNKIRVTTILRRRITSIFLGIKETVDAEIKINKIIQSMPIHKNNFSPLTLPL